MDKNLTTQGHKRAEQIINLLGENNIKTQNISVSNERNEQYSVPATLGWTIQAHTRKTNYLAHPPAGSELLHDFNELNSRLRKEQAKLLNDGDARSSFLSRVQSGGASFLSRASNPITLSSSSKYHALVNCGSCSGSGSDKCISCNGSKTVVCPGCNGAGRLRTGEIYTATEWSECTRCYSKQRVNCSHCHGEGEHKCMKCQGRGKSVDAGHVELVATPSWQLSIFKGLGSSELSDKLQQMGPGGATSVIPFTLESARYAGDLLISEYAGLADVSQMTVTANGKSYDLVYTGNSLSPLVTPAIFDDLLEPQLPLMQKFNKGVPSTSDAKRMFDLFTSTPVLNKAMMASTTIDKPNVKIIAQAVIKSAQGCISPGAAEIIGQSMLRCLDRVSPKYSATAWWWVSAPLAVLLAVLGYLGEPTLLDFIINQVGVNVSWLFRFMPTTIAWILLSRAVEGVAYLAILSPIAVILSKALTKAATRKLPEQYRRMPNHMAPFKKLAMLMAGISAGAWIVARYAYF